MKFRPKKKILWQFRLINKLKNKIFKKKKS